MSSTGGGIVVKGKNGAGQEGGGNTVGQAATQAAITALTNSGASGIQSVIDALQSALDFSQT